VQNLAAFCPAKPGEADREGELLEQSHSWNNSENFPNVLVDYDASADKDILLERLSA
jgi:hypothetical protein